jgi:hypothetical protein
MDKAKQYAEQYAAPAATLVVVAVLAFLLPNAPAKFASRALEMPNLFGMSLGDLLLWLASEGFLGWVVAVLAGRLKLDATAAGVLKGVALALASALVTQLAPLIPPAVLNENIGRLLLMLVGAVPGWLGWDAGATWRAARSQ